MPRIRDDFEEVKPRKARAEPEHGPNGEAQENEEICTAGGLKVKIFPPIKSIAEGYVVEGATILGGRPKAGKSWLALDCGLAVADGGMFLGGWCKKGDVLFIALEDNERRLRARIEKILGKDKPWPDNFFYATEWPRANEGGLDKIKAWIASKEAPRLVVIDVLAAFRSLPSRQDGNNVYAADYAAIAALHAIASEMSVAILIIHHLKKGASDFDPVEGILGSFGHTGAADRDEYILHKTVGTIHRRPVNGTARRFSQVPRLCTLLHERTQDACS